MSIRLPFSLLLAAASSSFATEDSRLVRVLHAGPAMVARFDVQQISTSPYGRPILSEMKGDGPLVRQFFDLAGSDPSRDLREIFLATSPRSGLADRRLLVTRGSSDVARVCVQLHRNGPAELLTVDLLASGPDSRKLASLNSGLLLAGDPTSVRNALALRQLGASHLSIALAQRMQQNPPSSEDRAAQLEPYVRKFADILAILLEHSADPPAIEPAIYQGALPNMLKPLDPHSIFFDPDNFKQLQEMETSVRRGFGSVVSILPGRVVVLQTLPGSPSARSGLQAGDEIVAINGYVLAPLDTDQLVGLLGQSRTMKVKLDVRRQNTPRLLEFVLSPEAMDTPSVERIFTLAPGIGYLRVGGFEVKTGKDIGAAIQKLGGDNLKGLVLDLRNNPGGVVGAAIETASLFLEPGQRIFSIRGRSKETENVDVAAATKPYRFPVAVLVNEKSASASEIIAAAMQEHHRGYVIGQPTYGKGLVQSVFPLSNKSALALTVAYYYTPEGRSLQRPLRDSQIDANLSTTAGGLRPQHLVNPEAQTRLRIALDASGSFTTFATDYTRREKVTPDFDVTNPLLDVFRGWLGERRIQPGVNEWLTDTAWIRNRLRQEILNQGVSVERGDEIELARDPLISRALDLIRTGKLN